MNTYSVRFHEEIRKISILCLKILPVSLLQKYVAYSFVIYMYEVIFK